AALLGRRRQAIGPAGALGVLLLPVTGATEPVLTVVAAAGGTLVPLAVALLRPRAAAEPVPENPPSTVAQDVRLGLTLAAAVALAELLRPYVAGVHWLVTSVLLTVRETPGATRRRWRQRVAGNSLGAGIAAAILVVHPGPEVRAVLAGLLLAVAVSLRRASYLWWASAAPPALLVVTEFAHAVAWADGAVRVALNVVGGALAMLVVGLTERGERTSRRSSR
ncbi:MAG: FUSC family protein, partial [Pseudonocardia sp.]